MCVSVSACMYVCISVSCACGRARLRSCVRAYVPCAWSVRMCICMCMYDVWPVHVYVFINNMYVYA